MVSWEMKAEVAIINEMRMMEGVNRRGAMRDGVVMRVKSNVKRKN